jgi:hypothetical protein
LTTNSAPPAACRKSPDAAPCARAQPDAVSLAGSRLPIVTSWPSSTSRVAIACPTGPVPSTPIFMAVK